MSEMVPCRDGYGKALLDLVSEDNRFFVMDADVAKSTRTVWVKDMYPESFLDLGISEQDMVGFAAGMASLDFIPFATTYSVFLTGRAFDQIRTTVCNDRLNVKLAGAHAGISVGPDGRTHQALEDVALMRVLPEMTVVVPCDCHQTEKATKAIAAHNGPSYIRFGREAVPVITEEDTEFELGKARLVSKGSDVTVLANGPMVYLAMNAAEVLKNEGISVQVVDLHTVKPLDTDFLLKAALETGCFVTAEEHQRYGGMGAAVSEFVSENIPVPVIRVGIDDCFGESGTPEELMKKYGLSQEAIVDAILKAIKMKEEK